MFLDSIVEKAYAVKLGICIPVSPTDCKGDLEWGSYIESIYAFSIRAGGVLVTLMIVYAGYIYLTSQGDSAKMTTAKDITFGAIIGYVLLLMIGPILQFILN